ncbi:hypothetical protein [Calidifontibacillus oryziterrae]|uniref:hypothetical protein n=1 Tax=Calidifontibacillus oryziterrae TaxID=1191699 RepID=UPI0012B669D5|nr:hypothetical protein [Calidifontibacillus oryziterrae]
MAFQFKGHEWEELARCWEIAEDSEIVKQFIMYNLGSNGFNNKQIRYDIEQFLHALIKEERKLGDNYHVYEAFLKLSDSSLAKWITNNLSELWT